MKTIGVTSDEIEDILKILSSLLHLSNMTFEGEPRFGNAEVTSRTTLNIISNLYGFEYPIEGTFCYRVMASYSVPLNLEQAVNNLHGTISTIYNDLFMWLVEKINKLLKFSSESNKNELYQRHAINIIYINPCVLTMDDNTTDSRDLYINLLNDKYRILCIDNGVINGTGDMENIMELRKNICGFNRRNTHSITHTLHDFSRRVEHDNYFYEKTQEHFDNHPLFKTCKNEIQQGYSITHLYSTVFYPKENFVSSTIRFNNTTMLDFLSITEINVLTQIYKNCVFSNRGNIRVNLDSERHKNNHLSTDSLNIFQKLFSNIKYSNISLINSRMSTVKSARSAK